MSIYIYMHMYILHTYVEREREGERERERGRERESGRESFSTALFSLETEQRCHIMSETRPPFDEPKRHACKQMLSPGLIPVHAVPMRGFCSNN